MQQSSLNPSSSIDVIPKYQNPSGLYREQLLLMSGRNVAHQVCEHCLCCIQAG